jgi:hypothetical protein
MQDHVHPLHGTPDSVDIRKIGNAGTVLWQGTACHSVSIFPRIGASVHPIDLIATDLAT